MPSIGEALGSLGGACYFTKLDANCGYWQMPLSDDFKDYTTFITPFGRYRCHRLPFEISSAPEIFHREMQRILLGCEEVICHMGDVLVFGRGKAGHDTRVSKVLLVLSKAGLTLNRDKCKFGLSEVNFLGHVIGASGIKADPENISAIASYPVPKSKKELSRFLRLVHFLGKFSASIAKHTENLRCLLKKDADWFWSHPQDKAFQDIKDGITSSPVLVPFDLHRETRLSTDASSFAMGTALLQKQEGQWRLVAYASRTLILAECNYAPIEKETLVMC